MILLILTCDRLETLKQVIDRANECFFVDKMYIYVDKYYNVESNKKQKELLKYIKTLDKAVLNISKENKGCSASMNAALDWICEYENEFLVLEDDILLKNEAVDYLAGLQIDRTKPFLVNLGNYFWGWYANKLAVQAIKDFDLLNVTKEEFEAKNKGFFKHYNHFEMEKEMIRNKTTSYFNKFEMEREICRRDPSTAWDRTFFLSTLFLNLARFTPMNPLTIHLCGSEESTRLKRNATKGEEFKGRVVMINGVISNQVDSVIRLK